MCRCLLLVFVFIGAVVIVGTAVVRCCLVLFGFIGVVAAVVALVCCRLLFVLLVLL